MTDPLPWRRSDFPLPGELMRVGRALVSEPAYASLWRTTRSLAALDRAGFLVDALSSSQRARLLSPDSAHLAWLSTPLPVDATHQGQKEVVLVSTGSFAPLHEGHTAMFDLAEKALADHGIRVLASYLSPSHDGYVATKPGADTYPALRRVHEARVQFEGSSRHGIDRLVDPWESLFAPAPVNFTTVIRRLQDYLGRHLGRPARVVYLFGADNAGFAEVLKSHDHIPAGICIGRPGHDANPSTSTWYLPASNANASSRLRSATQVHAPSPQPSSSPAPYLVRDEGSFAFQHWLDRVPVKPLQSAWEGFVADLMAVLAGAFIGHAQAPSSIMRLKLDEQHQHIRTLSRTMQVASMDACTQDLPGVVPVSVARYFRPSHGQRHPLHRSPRPGVAAMISPVDVTILKSSTRPLVLVDDDCATGHSMDAAQQYLKSMDVSVDDRATLAPSGAFDIVDARDFLPGSFMAGLAVQLPSGHRGRLPYMAPFVNLPSRALLPAQAGLSPSIAIWRAAAQFFSALPVVLCVEDMHFDQREMFQIQGFLPDHPLSDLCSHMAGWLEGAPQST